MRPRFFNLSSLLAAGMVVGGDCIGDHAGLMRCGPTGMLDVICGYQRSRCWIAGEHAELPIDGPEARI